LLLSGIGLFLKRMVAGFVACTVSLLLGLFFGYQFIVSESLFPGGIILMASFATMLIILIALFVAAQES